MLTEISIQVHAGDLLDHDPEQHIIDVGIHRLRAGLVHERRAADRLDRLLPGRLISAVARIEQIGNAVGSIVFLLFGIQIGVKIAGIRRETALVPEQIADRKRRLPLFLHFQIGIRSVCILYFDRVLIKRRAKVIRHLCVKADRSVSDKFLQLCREGTAFRGYENIDKVLNTVTASERKYILEGYLAPDTYEVYVTAKPEEIICQACGAKYPLEGAEIRSDYQYGISNEVIPGGKATVSVGEGRALLVKVVSG